MLTHCNKHNFFEGPTHAFFFKLLAELETSAENIEFLCIRILSNHLVAAVCVSQYESTEQTA
jgi:hypothetical protein